MIVHWIWLSTRRNISDRVKVALVHHFQDPEAVYFADPDSFVSIEGLTQEGSAALSDKSLSEAEQILRDCQREGLHILTYQDAAYPARLKNIPDPPLVLYYKGRLPDFDGLPSIGVVGTRKASAYGMNAARKLGYQIAACGGIVVSGMAFGIDGMATRGALTAGSTAVGVLGCGADVVYPASNRGLFQDMEQYGCLISEFAPGTPPLHYNFPRRNRIISGLCCGVLVVEAPEKSGALITAQLALDQGRDVFVVPGNIDVDTFVGSNRLLRDGATAISSGWDIMSEYQPQFPDKVRKCDEAMQRDAGGEISEASQKCEKAQPKVAQKAPSFGNPRRSKQNEEKIVIDKGDSSPYSDLEDQTPPLSQDERKVLSALAQGERLVDDVIAETGIPTARMLAALTMLQIRGMIRQLPGKRISRN